MVSILLIDRCAIKKKNDDISKEQHLLEGKAAMTGTFIVGGESYHTSVSTVTLKPRQVALASLVKTTCQQSDSEDDISLCCVMLLSRE